MATKAARVKSKAKKFVKLPEEDKQRMARLYEEVKGRLTEMSLIVARNLKMPTTDQTTVMLRPVNHGREKTDKHSAPSNAVEVHCTLGPDGVIYCGCYDPEAGTCGPC